jgi:hypothetical protein
MTGDVVARQYFVHLQILDGAAVEGERQRVSKLQPEAD